MSETTQTSTDHAEPQVEAVPILEEPQDALPPLTLGELPPALRQAAERAGWPSLMPVQARAIPYLRAGRDLMVQSRTGSGKTGAFLLPLLEGIDPDTPGVQALILTPTRELALQVHEQVLLLAGKDGPRSVAVYGGVGYGAQLDAFRAGAPLVVGTPGRILDHLGRGSIDLSKLRFLVFDEADRLLSMGFYPDMRKIRAHLPKDQPRRAYMFSATFTQNVRRLAGEFLDQPGFLGLSRDHVHVAETDHICYQTDAMDKDRTLIRLIEIENPDSALIFCNTKAKVHYVTVVLQRFGYDAAELTSDLAQNAREKVLERVRKGRLRFLVATDVAARGIDISELSHVFIYEAPEDTETYIHRAGRTGRAGATGRAITLVSGAEFLQMDRIAKRYKIPVENAQAPGDDEVIRLVGERVTALLEAKLREASEEERLSARRMLPLAHELATDQESQLRIAMLLDDFYQQAQHRPEDAPPAPPRRPPNEEQEQDLDRLRASLGEELEAHFQNRDKLVAERARRLIPLARSLAESEDEIEIIAMLLDEFHREARPQAPKKAGPSEGGKQRRGGGRSRRGGRRRR